MGKNPAAILEMPNQDSLTPEGKVLEAERIKAGYRSWSRVAFATNMHVSEITRLLRGQRGEAKRDNRWKIYVTIARGQQDLGHRLDLTVPELARLIMHRVQDATVTNEELTSLENQIVENLRDRDDIDARDRQDRSEERLWKAAGK